MTLKLRGLGLRFLDKARAARSADVNSYAALALKEWGAMVRSGEAVAENTPITEEELTPALVEEIVEETVEEVVEEVVEEAVEEVAEEVVEETVEEVAEEIVEEAVEEVAEEIVEETVEEVAEEIVEETVEEVAEEVVEETVEEVALEDASEEELAKRDPYYRRLSSKERRKLKRKNKNNK
jgi:uncharacterized membrane-anchored protein YjiN (DUF445 family)